MQSTTMPSAVPYPNGGYSGETPSLYRFAPPPVQVPHTPYTSARASEPSPRDSFAPTPYRRGNTTFHGGASTPFPRVRILDDYDDDDDDDDRGGHAGQHGGGYGSGYRIEGSRQGGRHGAGGGSGRHGGHERYPLISPLIPAGRLTGRGRRVSNAAFEGSWGGVSPTAMELRMRYEPQNGLQEWLDGLPGLEPVRYPPWRGDRALPAVRVRFEHERTLRAATLAPRSVRGIACARGRGESRLEAQRRRGS